MPGTWAVMCFGNVGSSLTSVCLQRHWTAWQIHFQQLLVSHGWYGVHSFCRIMWFTGSCPFLNRNEITIDLIAEFVLAHITFIIVTLETQLQETVLYRAIVCWGRFPQKQAESWNNQRGNGSPARRISCRLLRWTTKRMQDTFSFRNITQAVSSGT